MSNAKEIIPSNIEMNNVVDAFNRICPNGMRVFYETYHEYPTTASAELVKSHFKGIAAYKNKLIFTHTNLLPLIHLDSNPGKILIANKQTSGDQASISAIYNTNPYHYGWSHPCSAQACGSYMAMGLQNTDDSTCSAEIHILDLSPLDNGAQPENVTTINSVNKSGGSTQALAVNGVAMTKEHGDDGKYIVAGVQGNALTIYRSLRAVLDPTIKDDQFYVVGETMQDFPRSGAGLALITQTDGSIYLIALDTDDDKGSNNRIYLYQLTISDSNVVCSPEIASMAMPVPGLSEAVRYATGPALVAITAQDAVCGTFLSTFATGIENIDILNTSFRWGKGLEITSPNDIKVYATDRNDLTTSQYSWPVDTQKDFSLVTWATGGGPPLSGSKLAVVYFSGPQLRLYYQTNSLVIQEYCYTGNGWGGGGPLAEAVSGSSIAAVTWQAGSTQHLRVYSQTPDGNIQECGYDGNGWQSGVIFSGAAVGTAVSAVTWLSGGAVSLRVYVQMPNGDIQECGDDGNGWQSGTLFSGAAVGTAASAVTWMSGGAVSLRVYFQMPNGNIQEYCNDGNGWQAGAVLSGAAVGTAVSAVTWMSGGAVSLRVYFQTPNGSIQEYCDDGNGWQAGATFSGAAVGTAVSAVTWLNGGAVSLRVYFQTPNGNIQEYCDDGNGWAGGALSLK